VLPETLALAHTWPLFDRRQHFDLGHLLNSAVIDALQPQQIGALNLHHAGCWECDLSDNSLTWSGGVYDIFGLQRDAKISREQCVIHYCADSRAKMEQLRAYAIRHRRGFTVDVEIHAAVGETRWMRLIAAPVCVGDQVVRLQGLKLAI
jgi:PAS domain-containing protein